MEENSEAYNIPFIFISVTAVLSILGLTFGRKYLIRIPGVMKLVRIFTVRQRMVVYLNREMVDLRKATQQIAEDWKEMTATMAGLREQQSSFIRRLDADLEGMKFNLHSSLITSLEEEYLRNDQRFSKLNKIVDALREDFTSFKHVLQKLSGHRAVENGTQTAKEVVAVRKVKSKDGKLEDATSATLEADQQQQQPRNAAAMIKKVLQDFPREVKKHLADEREAIMEELRGLVSQLSEDRALARNAIDQAFATSAHHSQQSFEQFGAVGRDAIKCISVLHEKSENIIKTNFQDFGDKLGSIFERLKDLSFDVSSVKGTLDAIDGQFDEIYRRLETGCQRNTEDCESLAMSLHRTSEQWYAKAESVEQLGAKLSDIMDRMKEVVTRLGGAVRDKPSEGDSQLQPFSPRSLISGDSPLKNTLLSDETLTILLQACYAKLSLLQSQIDCGSEEIKKSVGQLLGKLAFLSNLVDSSVQRLTNPEMNSSRGVYEGDASSPTAAGTDIEKELKQFIGDVLTLDARSGEEKVELSDEDCRGPNRYPQVMSVIEDNLNAALKTKCMREIGKHTKTNNRKPSPRKR